MLLAIKDNQRKRAEPKQKAICPLCKGKVIAKCGEINIWHWAHKSNFICDSFGEPESKWHLKWKNYFPIEMQEVKFSNHIADIYNKKIVIELQNSPISTKQIIEREKFYGNNMIWILNGNTFGKNIIFYKQQYKWKWFPKSFSSSRRGIYIDMDNDNLMYLNIVNSKGMFRKLSKTAFIIEHGGNPFK